jgi:type I restriction enzyme S subunit
MFTGFPVAVPPIPEQQSLVEMIEARAAQFDGLVAQATHAITLLQERRSAVISAAVTGQIDVRGLAGTEAA